MTTGHLIGLLMLLTVNATAVVVYWDGSVLMFVCAVLAIAGASLAIGELRDRLRTAHHNALIMAPALQLLGRRDVERVTIPFEADDDALPGQWSTEYAYDSREDRP